MGDTARLSARLTAALGVPPSGPAPGGDMALDGQITAALYRRRAVRDIASSWGEQRRADRAAEELAVHDDATPSDVMRIVGAGVAISPRTLLAVCARHRFDLEELAWLAAAVTLEDVSAADAFALAAAAADATPTAAVLCASIPVFWFPVRVGDDAVRDEQHRRLMVLASQFDAVSAPVAVQLCAESPPPVSSETADAHNERVLSLLEAALLAVAPPARAA